MVLFGYAQTTLNADATFARTIAIRAYCQLYYCAFYGLILLREVIFNESALKCGIIVPYSWKVITQRKKT